MASAQRPSFSASSNTSQSSSERRRPSSSSYNRPSSPSYRLPPLPTSTDTFTSGTSIPAPPPISPNFAALPPVPPPKDPQMVHPITPKRKPVERQKSPLSNEAYFSSPASIMPGAFPTTPPASSPSQNVGYSDSPVTSNNTPSPTAKSPKRPGSVRNFLSLKALRRSYDNASLHLQNDRPISAGGDSLTSSLRPSLNKKRSGTFWRRKSSLGMNFGEDTPASSTSLGTRGESVVEEKPLTPAPEEDIQGAQKRKSGTFWRRKSSLNLANAFAGMNGKENQPQMAELNGGPNESTNGNRNEGQNGMTNGKHEGEEDVTMEDMDTEISEPEELLPPRSYSPPPQLPMFVGGGGGLGGEDMFKDIH